MGKDGTYETFDSGTGPVIPEDDKGNFDHMDNGKGGIEVTQGDVPKVPSSKD